MAHGSTNATTSPQRPISGWDGEGWFGSDINRLTIKTEGEGTFRAGVDGAEIQALYSRAVGLHFQPSRGRPT